MADRPVPSAGFRAVLKQTRDEIGASFNLIWASKGLEPGSGRFLHEVVEEELPGATSIAALSGPSFATEVARGLPTAVTIASQDTAYAQRVAELFHCAQFRAYTSDDVIGVELGGSVKNVLAIAAGISDGLGYGSNARAALITRGLAEIMRLGTRLGGRRETFMGLAGVGDLVLTCTDDQSRNRRLGLALGRGVPLAEAVEQIGQAVEGLHTAKELDRLAREHIAANGYGDCFGHGLGHGVGLEVHQQVGEVLGGGGHRGREPDRARVWHRRGVSRVGVHASSPSERVARGPAGRVPAAGRGAGSRWSRPDRDRRLPRRQCRWRGCRS